MRWTLVAVVLVIGCKSHGAKTGTPGELCIAENAPEHLMRVIRDAKPDGPKVEPITNKLEVAIGDVRSTLPNKELLVHDTGGLAVKMYVDGKHTESVRLDYAHYKTDKLCLYFRPGRDLTSTEGWKLDTAANGSRCHCWGAPAVGSPATGTTGSGAAAGSGGTAGAAGSGGAAGAAGSGGAGGAAGSATP